MKKKTTGDFRYYPYSCTIIWRKIFKSIEGGVTPREAKAMVIDACVAIGRDTQLPRRERMIMYKNILWMLQKMQEFSFGKAYKRSRWIGWIYANCEWLGLFNQRQIRNMARRDSRSGKV